MCPSEIFLIDPSLDGSSASSYLGTVSVLKFHPVMTANKQGIRNVPPCQQRDTHIHLQLLGDQSSLVKKFSAQCPLEQGSYLHQPSMLPKWKLSKHCTTQSSCSHVLSVVNGCHIRQQAIFLPSEQVLWRPFRDSVPVECQVSGEVSGLSRSCHIDVLPAPCPFSFVPIFWSE